MKPNKPTQEQCPFCGPTCYGGAAHNARMEDKAYYIPQPTVGEETELPAINTTAHDCELANKRMDLDDWMHRSLRSVYAELSTRERQLREQIERAELAESKIRKFIYEEENPPSPTPIPVGEQAEVCERTISDDKLRSLIADFHSVECNRFRPCERSDAGDVMDALKELLEIRKEEASNVKN